MHVGHSVDNKYWVNTTFLFFWMKFRKSQIDAVGTLITERPRKIRACGL